jgi:hypothetical protein
MAVVFITKLADSYCRTRFHQSDRHRKPQFAARTFEPQVWFDLATTEWREFAVPWSSAGVLTVATNREYRCFVEPYAGKGDHIIAVYRDKDGNDVFSRYFVGATGPWSHTCTLQVAADGTIRFTDISKLADADAPEEAVDAELAPA